MKVIIAGSRDFDNYEFLKEKCNEVLEGVTDITVLCGLARGADLMGKMWAEKRGHKLEYFEPDWKGLGKQAGILRNVQMGQQADMLICFWDGMSRGSKHMIDYMIKNKKAVKIFGFDKENPTQKCGWELEYEGVIQ